MDTNKILKYIRIAVYIGIIVFLIILKCANNLAWECHIYKNIGILCPSCGITRATKAILDFNFPLAIENNAYYTLVLLPIFLILAIDDIICIIINKKSLVEIILGQ